MENKEDTIQLFKPENDICDPELTILIPAMNEELTISKFIEWCQEGIKKISIPTEILIVDSSNDKTAQIAIDMGARVLKTPPRGLGQAYMDAIPFVRGKFIIMGDADCTYDFRELEKFENKFQENYEFIMGSRFKGSIESGAMPKLHRYFGTPFTTWILNTIFGCKFSDIHCGMRGITTDALFRMQLQSTSWEYASEMVLKSVHMDLKTTEVPINFYKDLKGRLSHMKRGGILEPWKAGWKNLRAMMIYGSDFFTIKPGLVCAIVGVAIVIPLISGPKDFEVISLSINWMLLGVALSTIGLNLFFFGNLSRLIFDYDGRQKKLLEKWFPFNRMMILVALMSVTSLCMAFPLIVEYFNNNFTLKDQGMLEVYKATGGLFIMITGVQLFSFVLLVKAIPLMIRGKNNV